jgi:NADH:ubiquinone oxidoreductase subunit D
MVSKIRPPIYSVIQSVEAAIKSEDIGDIKRWLGSADIETRLILEILNNIGE